MTFDPEIVPPFWLFACLPVYLLLLLKAVRVAPWRRLRDPGDAHVLYGATVAIWIFWQVRASVDAWPGLEFHLLFMTSATLMFGWAFALMVASVVQLGLVLLGEAALISLSLAVSVNAGVAIGVSVCRCIFYLRLCKLCTGWGTIDAGKPAGRDGCADRCRKLLRRSACPR